MKVFSRALIICLLAALLVGCGAEPEPIRLTPLDENESIADTAETGRVTIRTAHGKARPAALPEPEASAAPGESEAQTYVLNTNTRRFHLPDCQSVAEMQPHNRAEVTATRDELLAEGYVPCGRCRP